MELEIRVSKKSIAKQWFFNVFLVMAAVVSVLLILVCIAIQTRYYNSVYEAA